MTLKAQIIIISMLVLLFVAIIYMVKKRESELKYVLAWLGCDIVLIILTLFPDLMVVLARFFGIQSPINMIFFCGFIFSLLIIFSLTIALSRVTAKVRRLAQKIALMEQDKE